MAYGIGWGVIGAVIAMLFEVSVQSAAWGFLAGFAAYFILFIIIVSIGYTWISNLKVKR